MTCRVLRSDDLKLLHFEKLSFRQSPRFRTYNLAFSVRPEVDRNTDQIVDGRVRPLVEKGSEESAQRVHDESHFDAAVW